jgi:hypothetical protein
MPDLTPWKREEREKWPLRKGFKRNTGTAPKAKGKRVTVSLMSGELTGDVAISPTSPVGWAVETTRWSLTGSWHDVDQFRIL